MTGRYYAPRSLEGWIVLKTDDPKARYQVAEWTEFLNWQFKPLFTERKLVKQSQKSTLRQRLTVNLKYGQLASFLMGKFSSKEIESQYNLIKTLLSDPEKFKEAIDAIKKDISYMPLEMKKKLEEENITL